MKLAVDRGSFPNFPESTYAADGVRMMRNATTTTIAPTGTISIIAGASSGVEPIFALSFIRNVMDDDELVEVNKLFAARAKRDGFYSDDLMKKIAKTGGLSGIERSPGPHQARLRHRARHRPRMAHQDAGGLPEIYRQRRQQDRQLLRARHRGRHPARLRAGLRAGLQGGDGLPGQEPPGPGAQHRRGQPRGGGRAPARAADGRHRPADRRPDTPVRGPTSPAAPPAR